MREMHLIYVFFLVLMKPCSSTRHSWFHDKFKNIENNHLSGRKIDNLGLVLNFIRQSPEFQPLTISVILTKFQSAPTDAVLRYIRENSIQTYKVSTTGEPVKSCCWKNNELEGITWLFTIDHFDVILVYREWHVWNANNQYLIVFTGRSPVGIVLWRDIFETLWRRYHAYRVIVVSADDDFRCMLRYKPFERYEDGYGVVYKTCLGEDSRVQGGRFNNESRSSSRNEGESEGWGEILEAGQGGGAARRVLFENFQNLNNYPVNVSVFESILMKISYDRRNRLKLDKIDAKALFVLEKAMRASFNIKAVRKRNIKRDPFSFLIKDIEGGITDMCITGFFVKTYDRFQKFQFTPSMYEDKICFVMTNYGFIPNMYVFFFPFRAHLWLVLIMYNVLITLLWRLVRYLSSSFRRRPPIISNNHRGTRIIEKRTKIPYVRGESVWDSVGGKPPEIPRIVEKFFAFFEYLCYPIRDSEYTAERALLTGILFFNLIISGLYQSFLVSSLNKPFHYYQYRTVDEVVRSGKTMITKYENLKQAFVGSDLWEKIQVIEFQRSTKNIVLAEDKISMTRLYNMQLLPHRYYNDREKSSLYMVDECAMTYRISYILKLHSPYAERVNFVLLRMAEAGLPEHWIDEMKYFVTLYNKGGTEDFVKIHKLSLGYYVLAFLLLFIGLLLSTLIFFCELQAAKRNRKRR